MVTRRYEMDLPAAVRGTAIVTIKTPSSEALYAAIDIGPASEKGGVQHDEMHVDGNINGTIIGATENSNPRADGCSRGASGGCT
jgi:hypothetical protein